MFRRIGTLTSVIPAIDWPPAFWRGSFRSEDPNLGFAEVVILDTPYLQCFCSPWYCLLVSDIWVPWQSVRRREMRDILVMELYVLGIETWKNHRIDWLPCHCVLEIETSSVRTKNAVLSRGRSSSEAQNPVRFYTTIFFRVGCVQSDKTARDPTCGKK